MSVTIQTTTSLRYEGVVDSTTDEGDAKGVTLKDVKDITASGIPPKNPLFVPSTNIGSYTSGPADAKPANGDCMFSAAEIIHLLICTLAFCTDADISHKKGAGREGDLQAWVASEDITTSADGLGDEDTFGPGAHGNTSWDQLSACQRVTAMR